MCSQKKGVKRAYLRFLMYKESLSAIIIDLKVSIKNDDHSQLNSYVT